MNITEVRIDLVENNEWLHAFGSITFDDMFVVRDLKIVGDEKKLFVSMPSRKLAGRCHCGCKNHFRARYCNNCGCHLKENREIFTNGRAKFYADIAHPINRECREMIQEAVIEEYYAERERAKQPGYACRYYELEDSNT